MKKDPKYLGIPNIQFSLTDKTDEREEKFSQQRIERGFDDSETWSLDCTITKFILPRLKRFREITHSFPAEFEKAEDWYMILDDMIVAFQTMNDTFTPDNEQDKIIKKGLKLFRKHYHSLWW